MRGNQCGVIRDNILNMSMISQENNSIEYKFKSSPFHHHMFPSQRAWVGLISACVRCLEYHGGYRSIAQKASKK